MPFLPPNQQCQALQAYNWTNKPVNIPGSETRLEFAVMVNLQHSLIVVDGWQPLQVKLQLLQRLTWRSSYINGETMVTAMPQL